MGITEQGLKSGKRIKSQEKKFDAKGPSNSSQIPEKIVNQVTICRYFVCTVYKSVNPSDLFLKKTLTPSMLS